MPLRTTPDDPPVMNMIPMIDILFNLIIFLMVGTEFATSERNLGLQVPEVVDKKGALTPAPERRVIDVYRDGAVTLDRSRVTLPELNRHLAEARRQYSELGVLVRADAKCEYQRVADVLNECKQAGIKELGISVRVVDRKD
jgi:biopolymer transport protein ExbD